MNAEQTVPTLDPEHALRPSLLAPASQRQPVFWLALAAAAVVHVALVVGISRSQPHYLGDPNGSTKAIDVELVDEGELRAMSQPSAAPAAPSATPAPAAQAAQPAAKPPPPKAETKPEPKPSPAKAEAKPEPPAPQKSAALPALDVEAPQAPLAALPKPSPPKEAPKSDSKAKTESATKPPQKKVLKPPSKLDLSVPFDMAMREAARGGGGGSSATRPPGITRSGENDRFGHDVIRALKRTMPRSDGVTGKVTVRIFLNPRGNIGKLQLLQGSGDHLLDDNVMFSVYQASFPFPPKGATVADRTFQVTYIYR
jgi:periplasmic protein TonB